MLIVTRSVGTLVPGVKRIKAQVLDMTEKDGLIWDCNQRLIICRIILRVLRAKKIAL
jgi:hypothetical protein